MSELPDRPLARTRLGAETDLAAAWEERAEAFVAWARVAKVPVSAR